MAYMFVKTYLLLIGILLAGDIKRRLLLLNTVKILLIIYMHAWHVRKRYKKKMYNSLTESIYAIHYFNSIMVIEKKKILPPHNTLKECNN